MQKKTKALVKTKKLMAVYLLKVVFSIYLLITILITLAQMTNEYLRESQDVKSMLQTTKTIFEANLTAAAWALDSNQLEASLEGIQKISAIVGVEIINMDKPPDWSKEFPIKIGTILNNNLQIVTVNKGKETLEKSPYLSLIPYQFQLKKDSIYLGDVIFYSSNKVVFDKIKYIFFTILLAAIIKTIILWFLFIWAFNKFFGKKLAIFCQTMENVDIDNPESIRLDLQTYDIYELYRIESVYNAMFERILETKNKLNSLNKTLENKVILRTQQLSDKNKQLEILNQEKSDFLSIAAHDLKNPLSAISSFTYLIEKSAKGNYNQEKIYKYTYFIESSAKKMLELISNLLDVEKIESGNLNVNLVAVDLLAVVQDLLMLNHQHAEAKEIAVYLQATEEPYFVLADKFLLSQILDNLISNAIKYSDFNKSVSIRLVKKNNSIRFEVQDQGQGLTAKDKEKLFTKFSQLSARPTFNEHSTGLGLYIAQKLAAMLHTKIECESQLGEGSIFSLDISIIGVYTSLSF